MYYLYFLKSLKKNFVYVGTTGNLEKRFEAHQNGYVRSTQAWRPFQLIYKEEYQTLNEAKKREWFFKCTPQGGKLKKKILKSFLADRDGRPQDAA